MENEEAKAGPAINVILSRFDFLVSSSLFKESNEDDEDKESSLAPPAITKPRLTFTCLNRSCQFLMIKIFTGFQIIKKFSIFRKKVFSVDFY